MPVGKPGNAAMFGGLLSGLGGLASCYCFGKLGSGGGFGGTDAQVMGMP